MVMSVGLPAISRVTYQQVNSTTRKVVGLARTVRNDSILLNVVHRIVFDLDKGLWWVEAQRSFKLLGSEDESAPLKKKGDKTAKADENAPASNFAYADKFSKRPIKLPPGVVIRGIKKERGGLSTEGAVYLHFFPNGFNEQAIIYLTKEGSEQIAYSVLLFPTGGKVEVETGEVKEFPL